MVIERIVPGYYYLTKYNTIQHVPAAIVGGDAQAKRYFKTLDAFGHWYVTGSLDYNEMLKKVAVLRGDLRKKGLIP